MSDLVGGKPTILTADHVGRVVRIYHPDGTIMVRDQMARIEHGMNETELRNQDGNVFSEDRIIVTVVTMRSVGRITIFPSMELTVEVEA